MADLRVVAPSIAIALLGAYAGLDLVEWVTAARGGGPGGLADWRVMHYTKSSARRQRVGRRTESPCTAAVRQAAAFSGRFHRPVNLRIGSSLSAEDIV